MVKSWCNVMTNICIIRWLPTEILFSIGLLKREYDQAALSLAMPVYRTAIFPVRPSVFIGVSSAGVRHIAGLCNIGLRALLLQTHPQTAG